MSRERGGLWVVEMLVGEQWLPTTRVGLTRKDARTECGWCKRSVPADTFRVRQYLREER